MKYKTNIEITSEASDRNEAMEIVGDYLTGNIASGIDMKCVTKPVRFYDNATARVLVVALFIALGFVSGTKTGSNAAFVGSACQMAAVQPPLKTSPADKNSLNFKKAWGDKQTREVLNYIKK